MTDKDKGRKRLQSLKDNETTTVTVHETEMIIDPGVFSPTVYNESAWFAKTVPPLVTGDFLEIGTGAGIIALHAAKHGATTVTATDISEQAVTNAKKNFEKHGIDADIRLGDVYEPIRDDERFDHIFWNHPYYEAEQPVNDDVLKAGFDYQYEAVRRYIANAPQHLKPGGSLLLGTSDIADTNQIKDIARQNNMAIELVDEETVPLLDDETIPSFEQQGIDTDESVTHKLYRFKSY